jgi:hypothetical protein
MEHRVMSALRLTGSTSGYSEITPPAVAGDQTFTLPGTGGTLTTTNGGQTIEHAAGTASAPSITFTGDVNTGIFSPAADTIAFAEGGVEAARIDSSGRLLVGTFTARDKFFASTIAPAFQLEGSTTATTAISTCRNSNDDNQSYVILSKSRSSSYGVVSSGDAIGEISFQAADGTNFIQAARITALVDGTPGANDMPCRLVFSTTKDGSSSPTERLRVSNTGEFSQFGDSYGVIARVGQGAGTNFELFFGAHSATTTQNGTNSFRVTSNGNVYNTNGTYTTLSDVRLKENIVDASSQWQDIKQLRVCNFNYRHNTNHETHKQLGLIAQEAEAVSPGLVASIPVREGETVCDAEGNSLSEVKTVNLTVLYMKAVKALQEAMERIETLEAQNAAFEARLAALEVN